jgi:arylsulfatase
LHASQETIDQYRGKYLIGWDSIRKSRFEKMKALGIIGQDVELSPKFHSIPDWQHLSDEEKVEWDLKMALYAAVMDELDEAIGKVVNTLEELGQLDNTMIVFLSDNGGCHENPVPTDAPWAIHPTDGLPGGERSFPSYGPPWANVSNAPFGYFKSYLHEGGIATPLIVRYPSKVPSGMVNTQTVGHIMDLMPTFMQLANVLDTGDQKLSGTSLLPTFYGDGQIRHEPLFWEHQFNRSVRKGNWKLVSAYSILDSAGIHDQWELYDLSKDPTELHDLAQERADLTQEMASEYEAWAVEMGVLSPEEMKLLKKGKK